MLITRPLDSGHLHTVKSVNWDMEIAPALSSRALALPGYESPWGTKWWMITSAKAIGAFLHYHHLHPTDKIACTAPAVREKLLKMGIVPGIAAESAAALARKLLLKKPEGVVHLCAKHSRPEAGEIFAQKEIVYRQIAVYETIPENYCITWKSFDGWLLMSPRSLEAFACALPPRDMPVGAIGQTTAKALSDAGFTRIFVPSKPDIDTLILEFNAYLKNQK